LTFNNKKKKKTPVELIIGVALFCIMVIVVLIEVITRLAGHPYTWTEEVAKWMMIWMTFVGASYSFRNGGLLRVDYFIRKFFKPKYHKVINIIAMIMLGAFFALLLLSSIAYMLLSIERQQVYSVTRAPYTVTILALIIGSVFCIIYSISQIRELMLQKQVEE
jgi:TRAP-type C4-dicarboxylate transport system permease small subunit